MKKFSSISKNNNVQRIAIGKFESMHLGHMSVFSYLDKNDIVLIIKMQDSPLGSILPYKRRNLYATRPMYFVDFEKIKDLSGKQFLKYLKNKLPNLKTIVVGVDFRFGKNRKYTARDIPDISNLNVIALPEMRIDGIPVHSSYIREFIVNGEIALANKLLGRCYSIVGDIISGQGLGSTKLVPTINIQANHFVLPKDGVYATYTMIDEILYKSISFLGNRISTNISFAIETHILDKHIYTLPKEIEIMFVARIRDNRKFDSLRMLKNQILKDINIAKNILESNKFNIRRS